MKKRELKHDFIDLRAKIYTYDKIVRKLGISKPTAIKWGQEFAEEIENKRIQLASKHLFGIIDKNEDTISMYIEQFRRAARSKEKVDNYRNPAKNMFDNLTKYLNNKLISITLILDKKTTEVHSATFVFKKGYGVNISGEHASRVEKHLI
ncbi:MAG: hypothetical protein KKD86_01480, partial [Bacteroidetes bacterium]|nr:hypothetical protein [Bacteroidota bacterium]